MSLPCAMVPMPATIDAPAPPDDPPQVMVWSHGFLVGPCSGLSVKPRIENSGVLVRPMIMAPLLQIGDNGGIAGCDVVLESDDAVGVCLTLDVNVDLDGDRHAVGHCHLDRRWPYAC
jgi:hypothetical protein